MSAPMNREQRIDLVLNAIYDAHHRQTRPDFELIADLVVDALDAERERDIAAAKREVLLEVKEFVSTLEFDNSDGETVFDLQALNEHIDNELTHIAALDTEATQ
jgi:hypothetical protein